VNASKDNEPTFVFKANYIFDDKFEKKYEELTKFW
jgi:hypothetical protein